MNGIDLTVLMPVYNPNLSWLTLAIDSVLRQSYKNFEFLIINDGSDREISEILESFSLLDSRIKIIHNEVNLGLTKTLNRGIIHAETKWIARMDADDVCLPERFAKQMSYLNENSDIAVLGTEAVYLENSKPALKAISPHSYNQIQACLPFYCCFVHPSVIFDREKILNIGGYPDYQYAEDYALWTKILFDSCYRMGILKDVCLKYRKGIQRIDYRRKQKESSLRLRKYVLRNVNAQIPEFWRCLDNDYLNISDDNLLKSIEQLRCFTECVSNKFPTVDKLFLEYMFISEKRTIYKILAKRNFKYSKYYLLNILRYIYLSCSLK